MTNKDIYLSLNRQDETSVKKLLTNHKLEKEYTYNNDYIEVVLKNNNKDTVLKLRIYLQFVVSRLLGTGVDTLILWICSTFIFSSYWEVYVLSPIISFEFAVLSNFLCSYFWIWKSRIGRRSTSDFCIRFLMFNLSSGAGFLMKMFFLLIFQKIFGWDVIYCNLAALLISGLFNYFVADMLVFKSRKRVKVESFDSNDCWI